MTKVVLQGIKKSRSYIGVIKINLISPETPWSSTTIYTLCRIAKKFCKESYPNNFKNIFVIFRWTLSTFIDMLASGFRWATLIWWNQSMFEKCSTWTKSIKSITKKQSNDANQFLLPSNEWICTRTIQKRSRNNVEALYKWWYYKHKNIFSYHTFLKPWKAFW